MKNKPPYADDNGIVNNATQNQIKKSSNFKIKSSHDKCEQRIKYMYIRMQLVKKLLHIIIYLQLFCFTNAWLYSKNQKLDASTNIAHQNEIHAIPPATRDQLVVINCFLKVHLSSENNNLLLFLNDDEAEIKKSLVTYLDDTIQWKIKINDIESEKKQENPLYFEKELNLGSFSLLNASAKSKKKMWMDTSKEYYITTTINFDVSLPLPLHNDVNIDQKQRQRILIVTFEEQERMLLQSSRPRPPLQGFDWKLY